MKSGAIIWARVGIVITIAAFLLTAPVFGQEQEPAEDTEQISEERQDATDANGQ